MSALGLIETKGLIGAIEGADAMLKAADVHLLEKHFVGGGLVTITIAGEVSAVHASIDAAVATIGRLPGALLRSQHVIARPDVELANMLSFETAQERAEQAKKQAAEAVVAACAEPVLATEEPKSEVVAESAPAKEEVLEEKPEQESVKDEAEKTQDVVEEVQTKPAAKAPEAEIVKKDVTAEEVQRPNISELRKMKVSKVRQIARGLAGLSLTREEIKSTNKKDLIEAITKFYRNIEE